MMAKSAGVDLIQEKMRRWKRSLDSLLSSRRSVMALIIGLVTVLYLGPWIFSWLFGSSYPSYGKKTFKK